MITETSTSSSQKDSITVPEAIIRVQRRRSILTSICLWSSKQTYARSSATSSARRSGSINFMQAAAWASVQSCLKSPCRGSQSARTRLDCRLVLKSFKKFTRRKAIRGSLSIKRRTLARLSRVILKPWMRPWMTRGAISKSRWQIMDVWIRERRAQRAVGLVISVRCLFNSANQQNKRSSNFSMASTTQILYWRIRRGQGRTALATVNGICIRWSIWRKSQKQSSITNWLNNYFRRESNKIKKW